MKKIGIIGAMELEVETLKAHMTTTNITTKATMEFHEGTLNGTPVVIVRSGVGKVNAALCVQIPGRPFSGHCHHQHRCGRIPECRSGHRRYSDLQGCPAP